MGAQEYKVGQRVRWTITGQWADITERDGDLYTIQTYNSTGKGVGPWPGDFALVTADEIESVRGKPALPGTFGGPGARPGRKGGGSSGDSVDAVAEALRAALSQRTGTVDVETVRRIVADEIRDKLAPVRIELSRDSEIRPLSGVHHKRTPDLLRVLSCRGADGYRPNIYLHGPAGTGKTSAAVAVAEALGVRLEVSARILESFQLQGFRDAAGNVAGTPFRHVFEHGGVFLLDEMDRSSPDAVLWLNSALANGLASFPDATVKRHPEAVFLATGNTLMRGADAQFNGAQQQDSAAVDRWLFLSWDIDDALEESLARGRVDWLARVRKVRAAVAGRIEGVEITPRATVEGAALLEQGLSQSLVEELVLFRGLTAEQAREVGR